MSRIKIAVMLVALLSAAACGGNDTNLTSPTTPSVPVTDTFSGTLNRNGASTFAFSVSSAGTVFATLTSVADPSLAVGLSLGTWNGVACSVILSNDVALQGTTITGSVTGIGTLCARVYDVGKVVDPLDYQITVVHP